MSGESDRNFWNSIYKRHSESGGDAVTGWVTQFFPYTGKNGDLKKNSAIGQTHFFDEKEEKRKLIEKEKADAKLEEERRRIRGER